MPDAFEVMDLPRRPYLASEVIRRAFQEKARSLHPDAPGGDSGQFAALNRANRELGSHASRLRMLIGETPIPSVPPDVELGFAVAAGLSAVDRLLGGANETRNPILKALALKEISAAAESLAKTVSLVKASLENAEKRLHEADALWPEIDAGQLAALAAEFSFLDRWSAQIADRKLALRIAGVPNGDGG